jgi:hypothetical protein
MDNRPGNDEIFFATVSSAGTLVGSDVRITRARLASAAASLVWAGSAFGLAWKDSRDLNSEIYFNLIAPCP